MNLAMNPIHLDKIFKLETYLFSIDFRDSSSLLDHCGYDVHVPFSLEPGETQLTTRNANKSRADKMCRWVVEAVNGIFKTGFKIFRQNYYFNRASSHVMIDFSVAAALIYIYDKRNNLISGFVNNSGFQKSQNNTKKLVLNYKWKKDLFFHRAELDEITSLMPSEDEQ